MLSYISKIDFLGKKPILRINGEIKHKTVIGGILSIIIGLLTSIVIFYFFYILVSRKNFTVFNVEEYNSNQSGDMSIFNIAIGIFGGTGLSLENEDRVYNIKANIYHYYPKIVNATLSMGLDIIDIKIEKCNISRHFKNSNIYDDWKNIYNLEKMYCVAPDQKLEIQRPFGTQDFKQLVFWMHKCKNNTLVKNCLPEKEIDSLLLSIYIGVRLENIFFQHNDYLNPNKPYLNTEGFTASSSIFKDNGIKVKNVEYDTDDNYIGSSSDSKNYPIFYERFEQTAIKNEDFRSPGSFAKFSVCYGSFSTKIFRKYYKLQNMLADVGALIKGLISVFIIINDFISDNIFYNDIALKSTSSLEAIGIEEYYKENSEIKLNQKELSNLKNNCLDVNNIEIPVSNFNEDKSSRTELKPVNKITPNEKIQNQLNEEYTICKITKMNYLLILPKFLFHKNSLNRRKMEVHNKIKLKIKEQLDLVNIFSKLNMIDKLQYMVSGFNRKKILEDIVNPYNFKDKNLILNTNIKRVRDEIINNFKVNLIE